MRHVWTVVALASAVCAAILVDQTHPRNTIEEIRLSFDVELSHSPISRTEPVDKSYAHLCNYPEGTVHTINKRDYHVFCYNSKFAGFHQFPVTNVTWEECEETYNEYPTKLKYGFHWYPKVGDCYTFIEEAGKNSKLHNYDRLVWEKVFALPTSQSYEKEALCPLPGGEGELHSLDGTGQQYQLFCKGQARVDATNKNIITNVSFQDCLQRFRDEGGELFHWVQQSEATPGLSGLRDCEIVKSWPGKRRLEPVYTKNTCVTVIPLYAKAAGSQTVGSGCN